MSEPGVDADAVRHVATLARIELDEHEVAQFREEFAAILEYFDRLEDVPDIEIDEPVENVLRPDSVAPSLPRSAAMQNASEHEDGYFKGPPVG